MNSRQPKKLSMGIVTLLMLLHIPGMLLAQPSRTAWEMHAGLEVTAENPYGVVAVYWTPVLIHGDPSWYTAAVIPDETDAGWGLAPNGETIGFGGSNASLIDDAGYACWEAVDYTYFQTLVTVPENTTLDDFTISFSGMDDGSRITIFNSANTGGLVIPGSYVLGGGTGTSDLASYVVAGQNRIVITQEDDCPTGNWLQSATVVLNGQTVAVNQAPIANAGPDQAVTRTGALTEVTLDGSSSSDADASDVLTYSWSWTGGTASGVSPTISLAAGTHVISLTVDDQNGGVDSDTVEIVVDTTPYAQTFTVLGAVGTTGDTDPYIQALPEGAAEWSQAYLTGVHPWGLVTGTNSWLNFDPDPTVGINTRTPYRIRFLVPGDYTDPSMVFEVKADNRAVIWINDTFIDSIEEQGTLNIPSALAEPALHPGLNEIRITMVDWGGIVGINYRIDVAMTSAEDITDAVLTPGDAAALNNAPVADAGPDQTIETPATSHSVTLDASGSSDQDGNLLTYSWNEDGSVIANGVDPTITLAGGSHTITLTAFDGELSSTDQVIVEVTRIAPAAATYLTPADGSTNHPLDVLLQWELSEGATGYYFNLGTDNPPSNVSSLDLEETSDFFQDPALIDYDSTYYWGVTPYNEVGAATDVQIWSFITMPSGVVGESCDNPLDYGTVNSPAMIGNLVAGGHDWYSFTTDGSTGEITISLCNSSGDFDSKLAVFATCEDFVEWPGFGAPTGSIGYNDDACGVFSEISLTDLTAGTYYVVAYGYNDSDAGAYELAVTGVADPCDALVDIYEPNDVMGDATVAVDGDILNAALCPTDDSDFFAVSGLALGIITAEITSLNSDEFVTDTYLNLYDATGLLLESDDDDGLGFTSMISYELPADGTYYFEVVVSSWAAGSVFDYTMNITIEDPPPPAPQNLVATAGNAVVDLSWEPVPTVPLALRYTESVSPLKTSNPKHNLHPAKVRLAEIYARKQSEQYALMGGDALREAGDTCAEAIDYGVVNSTAIMGDLIAGGHDWYSFTTDGSFGGISVSLCNSTGLDDSQLAVFANCGDFVEWPGFGDPPAGSLAHNDDACGVLSELTLTALPAGTYYVAVYGYSTSDAGAYELVISGLGDPCDVYTDTFEPNNSLGDATLAVDGDILTAAFCPDGDIDWFAVSGTALSTITVETANISLDEFATDTYMNMYDAAGNLLDSDDDGGFGYNSMISYQLPADGIYYFEVYALNSSDVFDYELHVTMDDPPTYSPTWNIYRDGALLSSGVTMTDYSDMDLMNGTSYCYTVTQIMEDLSESGFSNEDCATPEVPVLGDLCSDPIPLMFPVLGEMGSSDGYSNDYSASNYMSGIDIVYSFSIPEEGTISGAITDAGDEWTAMFIISGCPDEEFELIAEGSGPSGGSFSHAAISPGEYFLVISNWPTPNDFTYTFDLTYMAGPPPMVELLSPVDYMMVSTLTPDFFWEAFVDPYDVPILSMGGHKHDATISEDHSSDNSVVDVIVSYDFYLGTDADLSDALPVQVMGSSYTPLEDLLENQIYYWAVSVLDDEGGIAFSDTASFWTNALIEAPAEFALLTPTPSEELMALDPVFTWMSSSDPDVMDEIRYTLILGESWDNLDTITSIMDTSFTPDWTFEDNSIYHWRVFAVDNTGLMTSNMGGYRDFSINLENDIPSIVDLITPDSVQVLSLNPEMYWTPAVDPDPNEHVSYEMQWWGEGVVFDSVLIDTNALDLPRALLDNAQYHWKVITMDTHDGISHSETKIFWTDLEPEAPLPFALLSPENEGTGLSGNPTFSWETATDPDPFDYATYTLQIASDSSFSGIVYETNTAASVEFDLTEELPVNNEYWWRVVAMDTDSLSTESEIFKFTVGFVSIAEDIALPTEYVLDQNYPNPFNPSTTIRYGLPEDSQVSLVIYDVRGNLVRTLESGTQTAGWYELVWDGRSNDGRIISTGLYLARIGAGEYSQVIKMLYLK